MEIAETLSENVMKVLKARYLIKQDGKQETPDQMFRRVAKTVAIADNEYNDFNIVKSEEKFYKLMTFTFIITSNLI